VDEHFWHPKNPLSKENSIKPASLDAGRSFLWVFMISTAPLTMSAYQERAA